MLYVVGGHMRTGTSMMMAALEAGGMNAVYDEEECNEFVSHFDDEWYNPNPLGLKELRKGQLKDDEFIRSCDEKLVKCLNDGPTRFPIPSKVIFMRRDPEEIRQSTQAFMLNAPSQERVKNRITNSLVKLREAENVELIEVWYRDVIKNPQLEFERIKEFGFPFDVWSAASIVDPELCRFRLENLEVGV